MVSGTSLWHHTWFSIDLELIFDFMTYSFSSITEGYNSRNPTVNHPIDQSRDDL